MEITFVLLAVLGVVVLIPLLVLWGIYNSLVAGRLKVKEAFSGIYVQLKRRADLIPNLVTAVKGYTQHERETLENLTRLRTEFLKVNPSDRSAVMEQGNMLTQAMKSVFAVSENYPNLKASENFLKLQGSLEETEEQVAAARRIYNANVNDYNTSVQQFPSNVVAGWFKFAEETFFQTDQALDEAPKVSFQLVIQKAHQMRLFYYPKPC